MIPNLLHPVPIKIQTLDRAATLYDEDLREPIQSEARGVTVVVPGQVLWTSDQRLNMRPEGVKEDSDGYVLFRCMDLKARDIYLKREDRFIRLGDVDVDVYVVRTQPMGHYGGGPTLIKAYFKDKQPSRNTRGA